MSTEEVATKLVEYCRKGEWIKAVDDLYAKDIVSLEPREMENMPAETVSRCTAQRSADRL
jgi:hypothetical protein